MPRARHARAHAEVATKGRRASRRFPAAAAYCGVHSLKPTRGRIATRGVVLISHTLDHVGLLAADGESLRRFASVTLADWQAAWAATEPPPPFSSPAQIPRLGIPVGPYLDQVAPAERASFEDTLARLVAAGVHIAPVPMLANHADVSASHRTIMHHELALNHTASGRWPRYAAYYRGRTAEDIDRGLRTPPEVYEQAMALRASTPASVAAAMRAHAVDLLITPAATTVAPLGLVSTGDAGMQAVWTYLGWPVLGVPSGLVGGLPVGIQLVGQPGSDEALMRVAAAIQAAGDMPDWVLLDR